METCLETDEGAEQMLRGFLSGIFWGAIVVVVVMGFASLLAPLPATVDPQVSANETAPVETPEGTGDIGEPSQADEAVEEGSSAPVTPGEEETTPLADTQSAPQPEPAPVQESPTAPEAGDAPETTGAISDTPIETGQTAPSPEAPEAPELGPDVGEDSITTNPAQPTVPEGDESGTFSATPETDTEKKQQPIQEEADVTPSAEAEEVETADESLLKPPSDLKEKFDNHTSDRLPTVTTEQTNDQAEAAPAEPTVPFEANAVAFAAAEGKPLMSIVLIDEGVTEIDAATLREFPYPLSIAINTLLPDAADRVSTYQSMGYEILAMIDMPSAAAAADVEVAMSAHLTSMPQAVAVMEGTGDGLQGSKEVSDQVTAVLLGSGHGLLMFSQGLNTAQKLASREGVPAASVFRDFDNKDQNAGTIRRFLDQAAFKANQEGGVIMVGRLRDETLSALLVWGLQDRAASVALAPVSAVIAAKQP